jgi:hypothetical protein
VVEVLKVAQGADIVHRDLKPENIFVLPDGMVKVADFGIARISSDDSGLTQAGQVLGTIGYMPPEQVRGETVDGRSDIFAVGVILYQMLVGANPFHSDQPTTAMYKISYEDPPALDPFVPEMPPYMTPILVKAMAKDPALRYQSAEEMLSDLSSGTAPDTAAILAAAEARKAQKKTVAAVPLTAAFAAQSAAAPVPKRAFKLDKMAWIAVGVGAILLLGLGVGFAVNNQQKKQQQVAQQAAILAEAKKANALIARIKVTRAELDTSAVALRRRVAINRSAVAGWDSQWKAKLDKYKASVARVEAHNAAERALAQAPVSPTQVWDPCWQQWTWNYPPAYKPDLWSSPSYPKPPYKLWTDSKVEVAAINKVAADAAALQAEVSSSTAGVRYFGVVYKKANDAAIALAKAGADLKGTTIGLTSDDPQKGRILHGNKLDAWNATAADQPISQLEQELKIYLQNYRITATDLTATSTPAPVAK